MERVCLEGPGTRFALNRRSVCPRRTARRGLPEQAHSVCPRTGDGGSCACGRLPTPLRTARRGPLPLGADTRRRHLGFAETEPTRQTGSARLRCSSAGPRALLAYARERREPPAGILAGALPALQVLGVVASRVGRQEGPAPRWEGRPFEAPGCPVGGRVGFSPPRQVQGVRDTWRSAVRNRARERPERK